MNEEKQISDPPPIYAEWVRADDRDATDDRVGRLWRSASEGDRAFWADLVEVLDKLKAALADAINPTAEDYDHAAEIVKLRGWLLGIMRGNDAEINAARMQADEWIREEGL